MSELDTLKVSFTHSQTMREKKQYTIYEIEVRSSSTQTWVIYKRYSHFYDLHQQLVKSIERNQFQSSSSNSAPIQLAALPPKRITRSLAPEFVEKRRAELQEYLTNILETPGLHQNPVILTFLEVPDSVKAMLSAGASANGRENSTNNGNSNSDNRMTNISPQINYKTYEERRVNELILTLKNHPSRVAALKSFEDYFFDQRPRISSELIRLLFQGRSGQDTDGGLAQTCGDLRNSRVAARAALHLLIRLLDVEKNKDAHLFLDQFCSLESSIIRKMRLDQHISLDRGNRLPAFKIIAILKENYILNFNPHTASVGVGNLAQPMTPELNAEMNLEFLLNDSAAWKEFKSWESRQTATVLPSSKEPLSIINSSLSIQELGHKPILFTVLQEILAHFMEDSTSPLQSMVDYRRISNYLRFPSSFSPSTVISPLLSNYSWRPVRSCTRNTGQSQSSISGNSSSSLSSSSFDDPSLSVSLHYRKIPGLTLHSPEFTQIRATMILPYSAHSVSRFLWNMENRHYWDPKFDHGKLISSLENSSVNQENEIVQFLHRSHSSPYKFRDSVLLRANHSIPADSYRKDGQKIGEPLVIHSYRSVSHPAAPDHKDPTRSVWLSSGIIISPLEGQQSDVAPPGINPYSNANGSSTNGINIPTNSTVTSDACLVTIFYQFDREAILILSPDLLGESQEFRSSLARLKLILGNELGYRVLRNSRWTDWILQQKRMAEELFQSELNAANVSTGSLSVSGMSSPILSAGAPAGGQFAGGLGASIGLVGSPSYSQGSRIALGSSSQKR